MLLLILVPILAFLFWLWWKRETNENEPPEYVFHLEWRKLHNVVSDGELITDPDDFLTVSNACLEKDPFYNFCKNWLGNGLISAPSE
ncbi:hypothetical protein KGM_206182 [Danaus plexippus plexippus]|uniref:Uncharacterized protein n=1 Tax=Danaus plexippus plexippus TaxID=278856 RepID=A0A212FCX5_DANPL|nr:hypothetical protein KGM_206182 [Danaus plexippus plexippus]